VEGFSVFVHGAGLATTWAEATVRVRVGKTLEHTAAESPYGPVSALDRAFRKAVLGFYPELADVELADYKVRILSGREAGTNSGVRVMVEMKRGGERFSTVGASENILEASLKALTDGYAYALLYPVRQATPSAG
jgi:2-isopropylmalate synthase